MPINTYTRDVIAPRQVARLDNPNAVEQAGAGAQAVAQAASGLGEIVEKRSNRLDTINRARATSSFNQEMQEEFTRFSQERDMVDPETVKEYNQIVRKKATEYLTKHGGGAESQAMLETQLIGLQDQYTSRMTQTVTTAQKNFIMDTVGQEINRISKTVYDDPSSIDSAFAQLNGVFEEYGGAMDSVDEMDLTSIAQQQIAEQSLNSMIDTGDFEGARDAIDQNPAFVTALPPERQASVLGRINNGLKARDKERNELRKKVDTIKSVAKELNVEVSGMQLFSAATGIKAEDTPQQRIESFGAILGQDPATLSPSVVAKIGFGVDLPSKGDIDYNQEYRADGEGFTPKGIGAKIKKPFDDAANAKIMVDKVLMQSDEFINNDNKQAGLAAMISFQKLIDDGAAVREGDIKLSAQGVSALDNMALMLKRIGKGAIATPEQIAEMKESAKIFGESVIVGAKTYIDPFVNDGMQKGYRLLDMGLPQQAYDGVFGGVKTQEEVKQGNDKLKSFADQYYNGDVELMFQEQAKKNNITVEQVKKDMGWK
jgi:hypothetical protein